jgi:conjugative transfer signal peptidase TraF
MTRGVIVLVCLPASIAGPAHARGYLPSGSCPGGAAPIGKPIAAVAGDTIDVDDLGVTVNGRRLLNSRPLARDSRGQQLNTLRVARHLVTSDELWLISSHSARSFDSRYFGPVPRGAVRSRLNPVLVDK